MNEEHLKGGLGLIAIWTAWFIAHLTEIKEGASILASIAAMIASAIYGWYWLSKMWKERNAERVKSEKFRSNGRK